jgi:hypothetical protein
MQQQVLRKVGIRSKHHLQQQQQRRRHMQAELLITIWTDPQHPSMLATAVARIM